MSGEEVKTLKTLLALKEQQLALVDKLDDIRDRTAPDEILSEMLACICKTVHADIALLYLTDRWTSNRYLHGTVDQTVDSDAVATIIDSQVGERFFGTQHVTNFGADIAGLSSEWHIMGIGIEVSAEQPLGSIVLAKWGSEFSAQESELLKTAEKKLDSAIIQMYTHLDLELRSKEIEAIYHIDHIRDRNLPFDEMVNSVLTALIEIVGAEIGYVMLFDTRTNQLGLHASTVDDLLELPAIHEPLVQLGEQALNSGALIHENMVSTHLQSVMCLPLILNDERIGVLGVINGNDMTPFNGEDKHLLSAIGSQMDTAIFDSLRRRRLRKVLGRSVGPNIMEELLDNADQDLLKGERRVVTVLYADIRQSTQLSTHIDPELLVAFINYFLEEMTATVLEFDGTVDKFIGDELMALFNAPLYQPDHALRAVKAALVMHKRYEELCARWRKLGVDAAGLGIGIATGELVVGEIGSTMKSEYTVIGQAANLGARLQNAALSGQVLTCEATYELVADDVYAKQLSDLTLQGIGKQANAYNIQGVVNDTPLLTIDINPDHDGSLDMNPLLN